MTLITNDFTTVLTRSGFDAWYHCLPPKLGIDQFHATLPVMVARDGQEPVMVVKEIDRTNLEAIEKPGVRFIFHTPYFTFDRSEKPTDARPNLVAAVAEIAGPAPDLDPRLPVQFYRDLRDGLGLPARPVGDGFIPPLNIYRIGRRTPGVAHYRGAATAAARPYLDELGAGRAASPWLDAPPSDRLALLDRLMAEQGIDTVLTSTPINVQELSGIPSSLVTDDVWALYGRESESVYVLSRRELAWLGLPESRPAGRATVAELSGATIGYEQLDLSMAAFEGFGIDALAHREASLLLRRWREMRSWEDLAFYVLGAQVTVRAIDAALDVVNEAVRAGRAVTELDAYERYRAKVAEEISGKGLPIRVRTYFTHAHGGNRSLIPARATAHPLNPLTSLKIDAGVEVYDDRGALRAASDITRSAVGSAAAEEVYEILGRVLVEDVIAACRPGRTGNDVFTAGTDRLETFHTKFQEGGFCPPGTTPLRDMIGRDIGHLLGKQEPATVVFEKGNKERFEPGMVAAAEIQWPYHDHCIGVEDVFMTTESEPINLTRPAS